MFQCPQCVGTAFYTKKGLNSHIVNCHPDLPLVPRKKRSAASEETRLKITQALLANHARKKAEAVASKAEAVASNTKIVASNARIFMLEAQVRASALDRHTREDAAALIQDRHTQEDAAALDRRTHDRQTIQDLETQLKFYQDDEISRRNPVVVLPPHSPPSLPVVVLPPPVVVLPPHSPPSLLQRLQQDLNSANSAASSPAPSTPPPYNFLRDTSTPEARKRVVNYMAAETSDQESGSEYGSPSKKKNRKRKKKIQKSRLSQKF